ncbi:MAG: hypothetical protein CSYNP_03741 [Syntrophus sp. SKADARSKE-3]|nr:hypothetical protein [Syntrophus sp. SKADARSKE-3]
MKQLPTQKKPDVTWEWIKHRLGLQGITFGDLGRMYGKHKGNFLRVKANVSPKYERIIADHVGLEPWDLWPDRYDENHQPKCICVRYNRAEFEKIHSRWKHKKSMDITEGGNNHEAPA